MLNKIKGHKMGTPEQKSDTSTQVDYEKRFADTQKAFTKGQQDNKVLKAKIAELEKLVKPEVIISETDKERLDDLKTTNPDAWRRELNQLELDANTKHSETLDTIAQNATHEGNVEMQAQTLAQFNLDNKVNITPEMLNLDVPGRLYAKVEAGESTYLEYIKSAYEYLQKPKVVGNGQTTLNQPNLGDSGGDTTPQDTSTNKSIVHDYANINL